MKELFSDSSKISSKRVLAFIVIALITVSVLFELIAKTQLREAIFESLVWLAAGSILGIASEKAFKKKDNEKVH